MTDLRTATIHEGPSATLATKKSAMDGGTSTQHTPGSGPQPTAVWDSTWKPADPNRVTKE